jgi:hypothetical protein
MGHQARPLTSQQQLPRFSTAASLPKANRSRGTKKDCASDADCFDLIRHVELAGVDVAQ